MRHSKLDALTKNPHHGGLVAAFIAALAIAAPAASTTYVTTNVYDDSSTDADMAISCEMMKIGSTSGELDGRCNVSIDGVISYHGTEIDLDDVLYCKSNTGGGPTLDWGSASTHTWTISSWSVSVSSDGANYIVKATCQIGGSATTNVSTIDVGDTTSGLKNVSGELEKR